MSSAPCLTGVNDAVILPQGQPAIEGKAAIRAFVTGSFHTPRFNIHWKSQTPAFSSDGTLAYMRSETVTTVPVPTARAWFCMRAA
jgi:ketosteroid isomerase-like protein